MTRPESPLSHLVPYSYRAIALHPRGLDYLQGKELIPQWSFYCWNLPKTIMGQSGGNLLIDCELVIHGRYVIVLFLKDLPLALGFPSLANWVHSLHARSWGSVVRVLLMQGPSCDLTNGGNFCMQEGRILPQPQGQNSINRCGCFAHRDRWIMWCFWSDIPATWFFGPHNLDWHQPSRFLFLFQSIRYPIRSIRNKLAMHVQCNQCLWHSNAIFKLKLID